MSAQYTIWLARSDGSGQRLFSLPAGSRLHYTLSVGAAGALELTMPATVDASMFGVDTRIGVYRSVAGGPSALDGSAIWLVRRWTYRQRETTITAFHANHLLSRRFVAYDNGSSYTDKAANEAGDQIKAYVRENLGASVSTANRDSASTAGVDISTYLTIEGDIGDGASLAWGGVARRNLLDVCRDIAQASTDAGTYLTFEITGSDLQTLVFRTYAGQRGVDRRTGLALFSPDRGNIDNLELTVDRTEEYTAAIALGSGNDANRATAIQVDADRAAESVFAYRESIVDVSNSDDSTALTNAAKAALTAGEPKITLTGDIVERAGFVRGIHYDYGDILSVEFRGQRYDCRLNAVEVDVSPTAQTTRAYLCSPL